MDDSGMPICAEASGANAVAAWEIEGAASGVRGAGELTGRGLRGVSRPACLCPRTACSRAGAGACFDLTFGVRLARGAGVAVGWGEAAGSGGGGNGAGVAV